MKFQKKTNIIVFLKNQLWLILLVLVSLFAYVLVYSVPFNSPPIRSDGVDYYSYLPQWFINGNYQHFGKMPIGEALMILPFFLVAHLSSILLKYPLTGYSVLYQHFAGLSGLVYFILGTCILKRYLEKYFSEKITLIILFMVIFGTNLFHYATYDSVFSHIYSFFLFSCFLYLVDQWYSAAKFATSALLGICIGMIFITRNINLLILVVFPVYGVSALSDVKKQLSFILKRHLKNTMIIFLSASAIIFLQLLSWKVSRHQWVLYSYSGEGFNFLHPQIIQLLFSVNKGLFFWSPILIFAVIGMLVYGKKTKLFWPVIAFFVLFIYLASCWETVAYGGSYGMRIFVETMPFFALGLALFIKNIPKHPILKSTIIFLLIVSMSLSIIQMIGYWKSWIPFNGTTISVWYKNIKNIFNMLK